MLTALVVTGPTWLTSFDAQCSSAAHGFTAEHGWFETLCRAATWTAGGPVVVAVTSLAVLTCLVRRRGALGWWLALTVAGSALANAGVKAAVERARPVSAVTVPSAHGWAFPSGHTQAATVTYAAIVLVVGWELRRPGRSARLLSAVAVTVLAGVVGLSRVFLGAHWPSDVLGGWLLGSAWVTTATLLLVRVDRPRRRSEDPASA